MRALQLNLSRLLILANSSLFALLVACGGGGYGGGGGGGGGMLCGGVYQTCPPPTVTITAPVANAAVKGTAVALTATAMASAQFNLTIASVQFYVDGTAEGAPVTAAPYTVNWDTTKVTNASHTITAKATDSMNDAATSAAVTVTVGNAGVMATAMNAGQIFPTPSSRASGVARVNLREGGVLSGSVSLSGMTARTVTLNMGFAGSTGEAILALTPHAASAMQWDIPAGSRLAPEQATALMQGRLYVIATSRANPEGEVRGQLAPDSVHVVFSALSASAGEAARGASGTGMAATTIDTGAHTLSVHVNSSGLEAATAASVSSGGTTLAQLARDAVDPGHFSIELASISEADVESFKAGRLSVSVATAAAPAGAIGASVRPGND